MAQHDDGAWFAPKSYGFGAGLPIKWQGWAMLAAHILIITGLALAIGQIATTPRKAVALHLFVVLIALVPLPLYRAKTQGGWRWRWGDKD